MTLSEVGLEELVADGLEHFDGDDGIEGALDVAIILEEEGDFIGEASFLYSFFGDIKLRLRNGDSGDVDPEVFCGVDGESAPAASDFEDAHSFFELQFGGEAVVFLFLSGGEFLFPIEPCAGVGHGLIEPERVEVVAEVVVSANVFSAIGEGVAPTPVGKGIEKLEEIESDNGGL